MRALFTQFSMLIGLLGFLNQLLTQAPLEKAAFVGVGAGLAVYLVLLIGDATIQRILEQTPAEEPQDEPAAEATAPGTSSASSGDRPAAERAQPRMAAQEAVAA